MDLRNYISSAVHEILYDRKDKAKSNEQHIQESRGGINNGSGSWQGTGAGNQPNQQHGQYGWSIGYNPYLPNRAEGYTPLPPNERQSPLHPPGQQSSIYPSGQLNQHIGAETAFGQQPSMYPSGQLNQDRGVQTASGQQPPIYPSGQLNQSLEGQTTFVTSDTPSVLPIPNFNPQEDAEKLHNFFSTSLNSEVVEFLCSRTNWQRQEIAQAFQSLYGEELTKHLMSDFNADFKDIILALMEPTSVYDARQLHKAVKGMSTNESVLIECMTYMTSRNNQQISEVRRVYKELYNVDPTKDLTVGNHGLQDHLASLCAHGKADNFSSLGTSKSSDFYRAREEVATRNLHDINVQRTENTYNQRSAVTEESHNVREHHINTSNFSSETRNYQAETSYSNEHHIRTEAGLQYGHPSQMYNPYETRPSVTEKTYGDNRSSVETDESLLSHILSAGSMQELRKIFDGYQKESMQTIEKAIESQFSGYIRDGLLAAVGVSRNKPAYFAKLLYEALNNRDSKINDLIRLIVSRSEYDMVDIRKQFQELYKTSLEEMIKAKCSGICKDVLVALVRGNYMI